MNLFILYIAIGIIVGVVFMVVDDRIGHGDNFISAMMSSVVGAVWPAIIAVILLSSCMWVLGFVARKISRAIWR